MKALALYQTTIGKKAVMAVTGVVLYGFVIGHMAGNLQVYMGPEVFNDYAASLKANAPLLWGVRITLLVSVIAHIAAATQLVVRTSSARPVGYRKTKRLTTGISALTMKYGGLFLFFFILFHLAHFTYPGIAMSKAYLHDPIDAYANFVNAFKIPWVSAIYIVSQIFLGLHLYHGSWSLFQSLGFDPRNDDKRRFLAQTIGIVVAVANISFPVAVLAKVVT
jgi:succinate dehydrogenase / fumarate reductase cytochrome b subunit